MILAAVASAYSTWQLGQPVCTDWAAHSCFHSFTSEYLNRDLPGTYTSFTPHITHYTWGWSRLNSSSFWNKHPTREAYSKEIRGTFKYQQESFARSHQLLDPRKLRGKVKGQRLTFDLHQMLHPTSVPECPGGLLATCQMLKGAG